MHPKKCSLLTNAVAPWANGGTVISLEFNISSQYFHIQLSPISSKQCTYSCTKRGWTDEFGSFSIFHMKRTETP